MINYFKWYFLSAYNMFKDCREWYKIFGIIFSVIIIVSLLSWAVVTIFFGFNLFSKILLGTFICSGALDVIISVVYYQLIEKKK